MAIRTDHQRRAWRPDLDEWLEGEPAQGKPSAEELFLTLIRQWRFPSGSRRACPRCGSLRTIRWGRFGARRRYRCHTCSRTFSDLTGTPFAHTKRIEQWIPFTRCMFDGRSVRASARLLGLHKDTALRWRHRLAAAYDTRPSSPRPGAVAVVDTLLPFSEKGQAPRGRPSRRRRGRLAARAPGEGLAGVYLLWWSRVIPFAFVVLEQRRFLPPPDEFHASFADLVAAGSVLCLDRTPCPALVRFANRRACALLHEGGAGWWPGDGLDGRRGTRVRWRRRFPPTAEQARALTRPARQVLFRWREWMTRFRGVATRHLRLYLAWFRELERWMDPESKRSRCSIPSGWKGMGPRREISVDGSGVPVSGVPRDVRPPAPLGSEFGLGPLYSGLRTGALDQPVRG
jgi:transposase-like protein